MCVVHGFVVGEEHTALGATGLVGAIAIDVEVIQDSSRYSGYVWLVAKRSISCAYEDEVEFSRGWTSRKSQSYFWG